MQEKRGIVQHQQHRHLEVVLLTAFLCSPAVSRTTPSSWISISLISSDLCSSIMDLATGEFQFLLAFGNTGKTSCDKEKDLLTFFFLKWGWFTFLVVYKDFLFPTELKMVFIPSLNPFEMILNELQKESQHNEKMKGDIRRGNTADLWQAAREQNRKDQSSKTQEALAWRKSERPQHKKELILAEA